MADQAGIELMRRRIERASRQPPPPRRATEPEPEVPAPMPEPTGGGDGGKAPLPARTTGVRRPTRTRLGADLPPVNLAIRVRKPLDDRLAEVIYRLRVAGVRTSKVELIEMLLWEMPDDQLPAIRERLRQFRQWAPRGTSAPLEAERG